MSMSMVSYASGARFLNLVGGSLLSFGAIDPLLSLESNHDDVVQVSFPQFMTESKKREIFQKKIFIG